MWKVFCPYVTEAVGGLSFVPGGGLARLVLYRGLELRNCVTTCSKYPPRICGEALGYTAVSCKVLTKWIAVASKLCICRCREFQVITILFWSFSLILNLKAVLPLELLAFHEKNMCVSLSQHNVVLPAN